MLTESRTLVSLVVAVYNEEKSISKCLDSIFSQQTWHPAAGQFEIEVLAVDGISSDGTRALLEQYALREPRLRIIENPGRRAPFAFNLGLRHANGDYLCIFGAHTCYRRDYVAECLGELLAHDAAACGGRVRTAPASDSLSARLVAWAMSHPFGSSRKSFRTQGEGCVDVVNYAVFRRDLVLTAGGWDEELLRNQDNDMNQKLRAMGWPLWCTWKTECTYFPKSTVMGLLRYAYGNGLWNVISLKKNPRAMAARHFVPFFFVVVLALFATIVPAAAVGLRTSLWIAATPFIALMGLHLAVGSAAAVQVAVRDCSAGALWLPVVFLGFHVAYGFGTLCGFMAQAWKNASAHGRPERNGSSIAGD